MAINAGQAIRNGNNFTINGRTYEKHDDTLYLISGNSFISIDKNAYKALDIYKNLMILPQANTIFDKINISQASRKENLKVCKVAEGK